MLTKTTMMVEAGAMTETHSKRFNLSKVAVLMTLAPFSLLTAIAVWRHGYWGIINYELQSYAGLQVLADLVIALMLVLAWMRQDARTNGRVFWPWLVLTLAAGSFGPLFYLLFRKNHIQKS